MRKCFLTNLQNNLNSSRLKRPHFICLLPTALLRLYNGPQHTPWRPAFIQVFFYYGPRHVPADNKGSSESSDDQLSLAETFVWSAGGGYAVH